uniref:Putative endonuclease/reverse transcript n=1 Tax=Ixodes ricinus TaxID=34613 RepID=V5IDJ9_IXORI
MLGYLRRNFYLAPISLKLLLYKTLVRTKLEYAASVWDPGQESLISELESVQNRASRFILSDYHRTSSVTAMKSCLSLPLLSQRRKSFRLCLFHKIYHNNSILKERLLTAPHYVSARIDHHYKVGIPSSRTKHFHDSFIPSTSTMWNHLPGAIAGIPDCTRFRTAIANIFL